MEISTSLAYLFLAMGVVLLLWVVALLILVALLRQRLRVVTAERDQCAAQSKNIIGLIGQRAKIKAGDKIGQSGIVLWTLGNEVGLQSENEQLTVNLADIEVVVAVE